MPLESINLFPNRNTPDLGCFIERKHGLEINPLLQNIHTELNPSIDFNPRHHQLYFRIKCGEAAFFQRCLVYMTQDSSIPPPNLIQFPPDFILGGEYQPRPSDWEKFPTQSGQRFYWFIGQHRNPAGGGWMADARFGHIYDIYENGTLSTIFYDDTGGDGDLDDFVLEAAIVGRRSWLEIATAENQEAVIEQFNRDGLPIVKERIFKLDPQ